MYNSYSSIVLDEQDCLHFKSQWRNKAFKKNTNTFLDLEIGPGSGDFFQHLISQYEKRLFIAIELKYKPLIQSARKVKNLMKDNAKVIRYNARMLEDIFAPGEINNVYIHFPDPWPKKKHHKHRLIHPDFVKKLFFLQKNNSFVEIKTDHKEYFYNIKAVFKNSPYQEIKCSDNLHNDIDLKKDNFITPFEKIFIKKNQAIYYLKVHKTLDKKSI